MKKKTKTKTKLNITVRRSFIVEENKAQNFKGNRECDCERKKKNGYGAG